jgi:hypothetical protein
MNTLASTQIPDTRADRALRWGGAGATLGQRTTMPQLKICARAALLVSLAACAIPEDEFPDRAAGAWCRKAAACGELEDRFGSDDVSECIDDVEDVFGAVATGASFFGCDYDPETAGSCVAAFSSGDCGVLDNNPDPCEEVYPDCSLNL